MWLPSYLYYVVCPRTVNFMDYLPTMLREEFARENLRLSLAGKSPQETPLIEVNILTRRPMASASVSLGPMEETIASATLKDPQSGLAVGTAICIGLSSLSAVQSRSHKKISISTPRTPWRKSTKNVVCAKVSSVSSGKRCLWANSFALQQGCSDHLSHSTAFSPR